ncbi:TPA: mercury resistance protein, partial [Escherichia coli]|nr:mercury resistance protein [Escherichia coli]
MNAPDKLPPETRQPVSGYLWGALAVLTCPCHLPILRRTLTRTGFVIDHIHYYA